MDTVKNYQSDMNTHIDTIIHKVKALSEEEIRFKPAEDVWSIMEIICHVEEVIPYWMNELIRTIENPGTAWGRGLQDEARLAAVSRAPEREVKDVLVGIEEARNEANALWEKISDDQLKVVAPHRNPKFGVKPMTFLVEHFITDHLKKHGWQIERNVEEIKN
ncbi:DinB family protein [Evansella sp. AB-P1]|uniref:DinB family protein n=1 Tax=Evansella sp. AB-P1 TaxID=3037653 RepID=UPI00241FC3D7|nr:DinB family protein [Evansella sp. AB-P1]MDG5788843.1 DinB family protein [Evansella sp. AB-P1]